MPPVKTLAKKKRDYFNGRNICFEVSTCGVREDKSAKPPESSQVNDSSNPKIIQGPYGSPCRQVCRAWVNQ